MLLLKNFEYNKKVYFSKLLLDYKIKIKIKIFSIKIIK